MQRHVALILLLCWLSGAAIYAQQRLTIAGVGYSIPAFRADSVDTFNDYYVIQKILPSIKSSPYELEIRAIVPQAIMNFEDGGYCIDIKGNRDSLTADCYRLQRRGTDTDKSAIIIQKDPNSPVFDMLLYKKHFRRSAHLDSALRELLLNRVTDLLSNKALLANLEKRGIKIRHAAPMDCCGDIFYEVKIGGRFRNFNTNALYYMGNDKIKEIRHSANLDGIVYQLGRF